MTSLALARSGLGSRGPVGGVGESAEKVGESLPPEAIGIGCRMGPFGRPTSEKTRWITISKICPIRVEPPGTSLRTPYVTISCKC